MEASEIHFSMKSISNQNHLYIHKRMKRRGFKYSCLENSGQRATKLQSGFLRIRLDLEENIWNGQYCF